MSPADPRHAADRALASASRCGSGPRSPLGRFDDAIRTAKTMFAMARHLGEHPTLVGSLVGFSIANVAIEPLDEMLQQPGCPNLTGRWRTCPCPWSPSTKGIEGERPLVLAEFRDLDDSAPMSADSSRGSSRTWTC